jgi:ABC-type thiamin/hydroxymethylpyrimidine transport system permease subunit
MRYSVRDLVYVGVFAGCWGGIEMTVGAILHALRVPFGGVLLTGAGIAIALVGRLYVPRAGSVLLIAVVTALLKMLSVGGIVLSPMIAIMVEGLLAEVGLLVFGSSRSAFLASGAMACLWPLVHSVLSVWVVGGAGLLRAYRTILERAVNELGMPVTWGWTVLAILAALHLAFGAVAGLLAWRVGQGLRRRGRGWDGDAPHA